MTTDALTHELRRNDHLLPKDIFEQSSEDQVIKKLETIYQNCQHELATEPIFQTNFFGVINYIYLLQLNKTPAEKKKKSPFPETFINMVLSLPNA